ncbi:MAG: MiaB/RimO family radical SAM methylthiotransferase [Mogibacterium sp.]|nr:MiaB/RimO family radical SAM methylthiotransferase [Mogibacterium sp.]
MRVAFHTLGCKVNQYETEAIREAFVSHGAVSVDEDEPADVYIINTCTVTHIADRKSRQFIRRAKKVNPDALVVVTGCYAQVEPEDVASMPEVDLVVGNGQKSRIYDLVHERLAADAAGEPAEIFVDARYEMTEYEDMGLVSSAESGMTRAYIKIQEGCDRFCAYCLIPYARGPVRSRPPEEVVREAAMLRDAGFREMVLTGINTALYGTEPGFRYEIHGEDGSVLPGLEHIAAMTPDERSRIAPIEILLARLDAMEGSFRIRLSSLEPTVVDRNHVENIIRYKRLCHHLHLSVQNGSNKILKSMNRHYTREEYLDIVRAVREYDPVFGITTDIIVGFPGETDDDFADTMDIAERCEFGKIHVFRYSPRRGTAGASLPDAVPDQDKSVRSFELEKASYRIADAFREKNVGSEHTVLLEERRGDYLTGYTGNYIRAYLYAEDRSQDNARLGEFCRVQLIETFLDGCKAVLTDQTEGQLQQ